MELKSAIAHITKIEPPEKWGARMEELLKQDRNHLITTIRKWGEGQRFEYPSELYSTEYGNGYDQALDDLDTYLEGLLEDNK